MHTQYKNLTKEQAFIGQKVAVIFCGRPVGVVGKPLKERTIVRIGRMYITLDDGQKVGFDEYSLKGVAEYKTTII